MAGDRGSRLIQEIDFSKGLVLGYSNREHEIPDGFLTKCDNFIMNQDGSLGLRPSLHLWAPQDHPGVGGTDLWDQPSSVTQGISCSDTGAAKALYRSTISRDLAIIFAGLTPTGTQVIGATTVNNDHLPNTIVGTAGSYGDVVITPFGIPGYFTATPPPTNVSEVGVSVPLQLASTTTANSINLYDVNGHFFVSEALSDPDTGFGVFARLNAIGWKGRIFVVAGTRVSYSAPGQPTVFAAASGGGFFNLDTSSQSVGAFVLQDVLYIATRNELFAFTFSTDPSRDGQLRPFAKINGLGAAEYDNIGYIAVREGLYRIISGQLAPTFIPSSESFMSFQTVGLAKQGVATERTEIPRHCSISKVGDQLILGGIGVSAMPADSNPKCFVFSTSTEAWLTWSGHDDTNYAVPRVQQWFNTPGPLFKVDTSYGDSLYWGASIRTRTRNMAARQRSVIVLGRSDFTIDETTADNFPAPRYYDVAGADFSGLNGTFQYIHCEAETGYLTFQDPLSWKKLHRMWVTGKFMYNDGLDDLDFTEFEVRTFLGPNDQYNLVYYINQISDERMLLSQFDISPNMMNFLGPMRFLFVSFRFEFFPFAAGSPDPTLDTSQTHLNIALSKMYADLTIYNQTQKAF